MGSEQSRPNGLEGFQIATVVPQAPAHEAGLIPFFDFVVGTDGVQLDRENASDFRDYIQRHKDKPTSLKVYNTKTKAVRDVVITPNDKWGGAGLLGCSINWENTDVAQEYVWHITDVAPNSPAHIAGIQPGRDYLIGMQTVAPQGQRFITMFTHPQDFQDRMQYINGLRRDPQQKDNVRLHQVLVLLYDHIDNAVREVMIELGTSTALGCDVANGYLHVIPSTQGDTRLPVVRQFYIDTVPAPQPNLAAPPAAPQAASTQPSTSLPPPPAPVDWSNPALKGVPVMPAPPAAQTAASAAPVLPPPPAAVGAPAVATQAANGAPGAESTAAPAAGAAQQYQEPAWASALNSTLS